MHKTIRVLMFMAAVLAPCAFAEEGDTEGGGAPLERVVEPEAGEEVTQDLTSADATGDSGEAISEPADENSAYSAPPSDQ